MNTRLAAFLQHPVTLILAALAAHVLAIELDAHHEIATALDALGKHLQGRAVRRLSRVKGER